MQPPDLTAADIGIKLFTGDGPAKPVTVAQLDRTLTRVVAMQKRRVPVIHVPNSRENQSRPREHRSRSRTRPTRGSPDDREPEPPPLRVIPPAEFRRELRRALRGAA
jgi:hypothetical protein